MSPQAAPSSALSSAGLLPAASLPLRTGTPFTFCLTDAGAKALAGAGMELEAVAPVTIVTVAGHRCVQWTIDGGRLESDLSAVGATSEGGFVLRRGSQRAEFTQMLSSIRLGDNVSHGRMLHAGQRIETFTSPASQIKLSATDGIVADDLPVYLAPAAAQAITGDIPASPLTGGQQLFTANAHIGVLPAGLAPQTGGKEVKKAM
ncbi:hypothetical protein [Streptomyces sp. ISL-11]|uniref:hypothetical protein n=1 Tax=Streptomyces sp. ISL-11 TaxID=2819174 RepID=UPI001BE4F041|nr:hypothetical protein [Streptomyces sp. ISL-11]MBT2382459.1 hypothetical protein [Streptomyces sp. ISL-11]